MTKIDLKNLQNGSDIRGFALDTEKQKKNLTEATVKQIAHGLLGWWNEKSDKLLTETTITIGHDSRLSGPAIKNWLIDTLTSYGVTVIDAHMATTPALFMSTQYEAFKSDIGIMITASHLPMEYNGLKFFTESGGLEHEDIEKILTKAYKESGPTEAVKSEPIEKDLLSVYAADLVSKINEALNEGPEAKPLAGRKIIVDAGNGASGFFATEILEPLGA
ncbi:MAG: phosphomannomutase/phosphoglucomutase, partial [Alkalibacterium sp.]